VHDLLMTTTLRGGCDRASADGSPSLRPSSHGGVRTVLSWIATYSWLSWFIPTAILALWIIGTMLFLGITAATGAIGRAWMGAVRRLKAFRGGDR
jgi:hypothetical protein